MIHCSEYLDEIAGGGSSGSGVVDKEDEEIEAPGSLGEEDEELDQVQDSGTGDHRAMKKGGSLQRKDMDWKWRRSRRRSWRGFG